VIAGGEIHRPVLTSEVVRFLADAPTPTIVDGTVGLGGHAEAILEASPDVGLVGIDRDEEALAIAEARLSRFGDRVHLVHGDFINVSEHLSNLEVGPVGGLLLDVGVSSLQLDDPDRGFSFRGDGPLDMRMDRTAGRPASAWLASVEETELADVLRTYGEERYARRIAREIVRARAEEAILTTGVLRKTVHRAVPGRYFDGPIDPATRTFQAIRIVVNRELESLSRGLEVGFGVLAIGGVLVSISFHSLEDRIVKRFLRERAADCVCPPDLPECVCDKTVEAEILTRKPVRPTRKEVAENPRARSAKLRAARKVAEFVS